MAALEQKGNLILCSVYPSLLSRDYEKVFCRALIFYLSFFPQLNLASQSVLEGLNACFDHRAEIYVPELGMNFHVQHKKTKIFGCQNPYRQGGGRKGLPKSFLNRFTQASLFV